MLPTLQLDQEDAVLPRTPLCIAVVRSAAT